MPPHAFCEQAWVITHNPMHPRACSCACFHARTRSIDYPFNPLLINRKEQLYCSLAHQRDGDIFTTSLTHRRGRRSFTPSLPTNETGHLYSLPYPPTRQTHLYSLLIHHRDRGIFTPSLIHQREGAPSLPPYLPMRQGLLTFPLPINDLRTSLLFSLTHQANRGILTPSLTHRRDRKILTPPLPIDEIGKSLLLTHPTTRQERLYSPYPSRLAVFTPAVLTNETGTLYSSLTLQRGRHIIIYSPHPPFPSMRQGNLSSLPDTHQ